MSNSKNLMGLVALAVIAALLLLSQTADVPVWLASL